MFEYFWWVVVRYGLLENFNIELLLFENVLDFDL